MPPSRASFEKLVVDTRDKLARYLRRYLASPDDVQDVLQEAYLKVFCVLRSRDRAGHAPSALLYTTARNLAISRLRHRQVVARSAGAVALSEELRRDTKSLEQQLTQSERRRDLLEVVNALPPRCRQVFVLRLVDGLSQRAIGERLGIAVSTVEKHLARGLRLCRERMASSRDAGRASQVAVCLPSRDRSQ